MGWFTRKPKTRIVSVSFRELTSDRPPEREHAYCYTWSLSSAPVIGARVIVTGGDGRPAHAVIAAVDVRPPSGMSLKAVTRLVTTKEIAAARAAQLADATAWLDMARKAAGLPSDSRRRSVPSGYPKIAPADGEPTPKQAEEYGRMWWRAFKLAEELDRQPDEVKRYQQIAHRWYAIRDRAKGKP